MNENFNETVFNCITSVNSLMTSNEVAKEQQYVADAFYQQKLIPNKINIQAAILAN